MAKQSRTGTGGAPAEKGRSVKVARDIVAIVKRTAALTDKKVDAFVEPLLVRCAQRVDEEIARDGVDAVTRRANALVHLTPNDAVGPFNVVAAVATPLARKAGYCQTSIAKLVDPYLRAMAYEEYVPALRDEAKRTRAVSPDSDFTVALCARGAAGRPTHSYELTDEFNFTAAFGGEDVFMLQVKGQSMVEAHIAPGDYVVLRQSPEAQPGDVVVAMVDGEPTLKQLKRDVDRQTGRSVLRLYPCNSEMPPMDFKDAADSIVGVKIGVVRYKTPKREPRREPGARRKK